MLTLSNFIFNIIKCNCIVKNNILEVKLNRIIIKDESLTKYCYETYFPKLFGYVEQFLFLDLSNEEHQNKILDIFNTLYNDLGFIDMKCIELYRKKSLRLKFNDIKPTVELLITLYLLYGIFHKYRHSTFSSELASLFIDFLKSLEIKTKYIRRALYSNKYEFFNTPSLLKEVQPQLVKIFNSIKTTKKIFINENNELKIEINNFYYLYLYILIEEHSYFKNTECFFICNKCGKEFIKTSKMNNIKYCENCRKEIQKEQMVIYRKKVKIIKYLQNIECELKKLDDFDFVKYNLYINSVTNKKNNVEKYSLEELNEYYNSLKNLLTKT